MKASIEIYNSQSKILIDKNNIKTLIEKLLDYLKEKIKNVYKSYYIVVSLVGDEEIELLNKTYRGIDKPTDVLSFLMGGFIPRKGYYLGDIIISTDTLIKEAKDWGNSIEDQFRFFLIHGLLHLIGYDHQGIKLQEKMEDLENFLFENLTELKPLIKEAKF